MFVYESPGHGEGPFDIGHGAKICASSGDNTKKANSEVQPKSTHWFSTSKSCIHTLVGAACCATASLFKSIHLHLSTGMSRSTGWQGLSLVVWSVSTVEPGVALNTKTFSLKSSLTSCTHCRGKHCANNEDILLKFISQMIHFFMLLTSVAAKAATKYWSCAELRLCPLPPPAREEEEVFIAAKNISYHIIPMTVSSHESVKHLRLCLALHTLQVSATILHLSRWPG